MGICIIFIDFNYKLDDEKFIIYFGIILGKGGVGKFSVIVNFVVVFKRLGYKVGVIDMDVYGFFILSIFNLFIELLDILEDDEFILVRILDDI